MGAEQTTTPPALTAAQMATIDPETDDTMGQSIPITESRLFDLVRYARYWLQDEHVISMGEWTWLTMSATGEGAGSVSRNRLEENDRLRAAYTTAQARIEAGAKTLEAREQEIAQNHRDWTALRAENTELRARIEALEGERDALDKQVVSCGHELANMASGWMRETAAKEQAETALTAARTRAEGLEGVIREYLAAQDALDTYQETLPIPHPIITRLDGAMEAMKAAITPPPATTGEEPLAKRWAHPNGPYEGCGCDYDGWGTRLRACAEHRAKEPTR